MPLPVLQCHGQKGSGDQLLAQGAVCILEKGSWCPQALAWSDAAGDRATRMLNPRYSLDTVGDLGGSQG